ncbi:addiction module toxin RelE [Flavivirga aquatica]|uniref:Addiction module toxin RelE n=1 Tax=Flavivirga aquatica TaxID=1849968 RepID=A0A1E5TEJ6_9FLAO|nr:type II toxin-antitoxin system HigB family toxin [Flavivirga aquatica]OEK09768.1 addiction module toxin RelE [Flavivirga aquatica]
MLFFGIKSIKFPIWEKYPDSETALIAWYEIFSKTEFLTPNEITDIFKSADFVGNNKIVFNICGNKYRLIIKFRYKAQFALIKFIGTHKEYNKIDVKEL